jgi:hypothetical protein
VWLDSNAPESITSWESLLSKFYNKFFPMSKVNEARKAINSFTQDEDEKFSESWGVSRICLLYTLLMVMKSDNSCNSSTKGCLSPIVA